jgi:hypothetical protein
MTELIVFLSVCGALAGLVILAGLYLFLFSAEEEEQDFDPRRMNKVIEKYIEYENEKSMSA